MKARTLSYVGIAFVTAFASLATILTPMVDAAADTCSWTGGGADKLASNALNWTGCDNGGLPEDGDSLEFPMSAVPTNISNYPDPILFNSNLSIAGINFTGTSPTGGAYNNYGLGGSGTITLTGPVNNTSDRPAVVALNVTLGQSTVITNSTVGSGIYFGASNNPGYQILSLGTYNLTFVGSGYVSIYSNIAGSGMITLPSGGNIGSYNNSGFTGTIKSTEPKSYLSFSKLEAIKGIIDVAVDGTLYLTVARADTITIDASITINGDGFVETNDGITYNTPAISVNISGAVANPSVVEFTNTTLNTNTTISSYVQYDDKVKFTGSGLGAFTMTPIDGSQGTLIFGGETFRAKPATYTISGNTSYPVTVFDNSITIVNGQSGNITINKGGVLKGKGTVGTITNNAGTVATGESPGILNSGNVTYIGGTQEVEVGGTTAGEYDQLNVTGTVDLGATTTLTVTHWNSFRPALNNQFVIVNNDGADAVTGTFQGLGQGATVTVDGIEYTISYTGGDGNDVVLTATNVPATPAAPNTGFELVTTYPIATLVVTILALGSLIYTKKLHSVKNK